MRFRKPRVTGSGDRWVVWGWHHYPSGAQYGHRSCRSWEEAIRIALTRFQLGYYKKREKRVRVSPIVAEEIG